MSLIGYNLFCEIMAFGTCNGFVRKKLSDMCYLVVLDSCTVSTGCRYIMNGKMLDSVAYVHMQTGECAHAH